MHSWWHQIGRFLWWGGTPEGALFIVAMGGVGGLVTGAIVLALRVVWALPQAWREVRAERRAPELFAMSNSKDGSDDGPAVTPTSDI